LPQTASERRVSTMRFPLALRNEQALARPVRARPAKPGRPAAHPLCLEPLEDRCLPSNNIVFEWTDLLLDVGRMRSQNNAVASRAVAIMEAAIYDSVNAIDHAYSVYHVD